MINDEEEIDALENVDNQPIIVVQTQQERYAMQRDHAVARIKAIIENIALYENDVFSLATRRDMLKECHKNFDIAQSWLEQWVPDESTKRDTVEMQYVSGLALFEKTIASKKTSAPDTLGRDNVRLPSVDLPIFNGDNENWLEWHDKYNALIHRRSSLAVIQKFEYLKVSLRGTALAIIDSLPTTESNYVIAYDLLTKRYNNPKLLVQKHTRQLFELKTVEEESASALRNLFDSARKHLRCLQLLEQPVEAWDAVLIHLIANKLDATTRREWESSASGTTPPSYEKLEQFVLDRCQMLDSIPKKRKPSEQFSQQKKYRPEVRTMTVRADQVQGCIVCGEEHYVGKCHRFEQKSLDDKVKLIKRFALCFNCLKLNHTADKCRNRGCFKCGGKHHTSIHRENPQRTDDTETRRHERQHQRLSDHWSSKSLLPTASVVVTSDGKPPVPCRVLLDSGSQSNIASSGLIKHSGTPVTDAIVKLVGLGNRAQRIEKQAYLTIKARTSEYQKTIPVLVTDYITGPLPQEDVDISEWDLSEVNLADPEFHLSRPVDLLLGAEVMFDIIRDGNMKLAHNLPSIQNSALGWLVGGDVTRMRVNGVVAQFMTGRVTNLHIRKWTEEEILCEQLFVETTERDTNGRFVVRLPLKQNAHELGESRHTAMKRLFQLEKRFQRDPALQEEYVSFMKNYLDLGHMELIRDDEITSNPVKFYFPHHPVIKTESSTTKLRTVFNGSAETSSGISLNDVLMTGPSIQQDMFDILIRFRWPRFVFTADIKKMFRQIIVNQKDRLLQLILWRFSANDAVRTFILNTVTYGTCSAPFIAARCLKELATLFKDQYPEACEVLENDFYMDDVLTGQDDVEKLILIKEQLDAILNSAGFELHKWESNFASERTGDSEERFVKILGLRWNPQADLISFSNEVSNHEEITKRNILSEVQRIFDPLGMLSPIIVNGKLLMQDIWQEKLNWDERLPDAIVRQWRWFYKQLSRLSDITLPRRVVSGNHRVELHGFADAAKRAYGAVVYVRTINGEEAHTELLCSKSRVAPSNEKCKNEYNTAPKLELRGAALLVELMEKVKGAIGNIPIHAIHYWTDSQVTLEWINKPAHRWPKFVANRVEAIQRKTSSNDWHYVRSKDNPADLISRGTSTRKLIESSLWWTGPKFLLENNQPWNQEPQKAILVSTIEQTQPTCKEDDDSLIDRFSSYGKLQRIAAYCFRFAHNCRRQPNERLFMQLTLSELKTAEIHLIKMTQRKQFSAEIKSLRADKSVAKQSSLLTLNPFLDKNGVIRVGGRLQAAGISYDQQHPIVLPSKCNLTVLIARDYHRKFLHVGSQNLLYLMRMRFWPLHGKNLVRKVVHQCITCFKNNPKALQQIMWQLPSERMNPSRPFQFCGVDFGGPFTIKENLVRTNKCLKVYVALFICLGTRAVHIELVSGLSSASFIAALRRFCSQRGVSSTIFCDNATNFVGSKNELKVISEKFNSQVEPEVKQFCTAEGINWQFIPPRSPNFGGIWEAGIKSVKHHMKRVLGTTVPTYEEMLTLLKQIEGCLNSRPISPMSNDPGDLEPLTPGHFLIGGPITALPDENVSQIPSNRLSRFAEIQKNVQLFWNRWKMEYLNNLQQRAKRLSVKQRNLEVGQLCLVKDDHLPPLSWISGRVIKVFPGPDGNTRVATLLTSKGEIKRSIGKLCLLPLEDSVGGGNM